MIYYTINFNHKNILFMYTSRSYFSRRDFKPLGHVINFFFKLNQINERRIIFFNSINYIIKLGIISLKKYNI